MGQSPSSPSSQDYQDQQDQDQQGRRQSSRLRNPNLHSNSNSNSNSNLNQNSKRNRDSGEDEDEDDDQLRGQIQDDQPHASGSTNSSSDSKSNRKRKLNLGNSLKIGSSSNPNQPRRSTRNSISSSSSTQSPATNNNTSSSTASKLRALARGKGKSKLRSSGSKNATVEDVEDEEMKDGRGSGQRGDDEESNYEMETDGKGPKAKSEKLSKGKSKAREQSRVPTGSGSSSAGQSRSTTSTTENSSPSSSSSRTPSSSLGAALARFAARGSASSNTASNRDSTSVASSAPTVAPSGNPPPSSSSPGIPSGLPAALGALGAIALGLPLITGPPGEAPGPLHALLSDIMGPTSLPGMLSSGGAASGAPGSGSAGAGAAGGSGTGTGPGNGNGTAAGGTNGRGGGGPARTGGTSIIVQGALLARTLPSTPRARSEAAGDEDQPRNKETSDSGVSARDARANRRSQHGAAAAGTAPNHESSTSSAPSPTSSAPSPVDAGPGPEQNEGMPQAATIEDQASMLQRLLSVASAATALSLVTSDQEAAISERASQAASGGRSTSGQSGSAASDVRTTVSDTFRSLGGSRPIAGNSRTGTSNRNASIPTSDDTASIANELRGSLRNRLSGETPSSPSNASSVAAAQHGSESSQGSSFSQEANSPSEQSAQSASRMGRMLQDTLRGGFGRPMGTSNNSNDSASSGSNGSSHGRNTPQTQLESVNETLAAARNGLMERGGGEGSFQNFMYDLIQDLGVAVRATSPEFVENDEDEAEDEVTRQRREGDLNGGGLSFYRLFRFEPQPRNSDSTSPPPLIPALIVGVRSIGSTGGLFGSMSDGPGAGTGSGAGTGNDSDPDDEEDQHEDEYEDDNGDNTFSFTRSRTQRGGVAVTQGERRRSNDTRNNGGNGNPNELPASRFLLFICGGSYAESHPLLSAPANVASRDVLQLIEILSIFNAMGMATAMGGPAKPPTASDQELEQANFKFFEGKDIAAAASSGEIHESTAEKCLICWEEWKDHDECRCLDCRHAFHQECVYKWLKTSSNSCPCCRRPAVAKEGGARSQQSSSPSVF